MTDVLTSAKAPSPSLTLVYSLVYSLVPRVGVICFLVAPVGPPEAPTKERQERQAGEARTPNLRRQLKQKQRDFKGATERCCSRIPCCQGLATCVTSHGGAALASLVQCSMGISAVAAAYALYASGSAMPLAARFIVSVCMTVQAVDSLSYVLVAIGITSVERLRLRVNARKDKFEESCTVAAAGLIKSTRATAIATARHARRVYFESARKARASIGGAREGGSLDGDPEQLPPVSGCERSLLVKVDRAGEYTRGSPLKCLVSTLNVVIFCNGMSCHIPHATFPHARDGRGGEGNPVPPPCPEPLPSPQGSLGLTVPSHLACASDTAVAGIRDFDSGPMLVVLKAQLAAALGVSPAMLRMPRMPNWMPSIGVDWAKWRETHLRPPQQWHVWGGTGAAVGVAGGTTLAASAPLSPPREEEEEEEEVVEIELSYAGDDSGGGYKYGAENAEGTNGKADSSSDNNNHDKAAHGDNGEAAERGEGANAEANAQGQANAGSSAGSATYSDLGTAAAAISATTTAAASTAFVRKRVRPQEYKLVRAHVRPGGSKPFPDLSDRSHQAPASLYGCARPHPTSHIHLYLSCAPCGRRWRGRRCGARREWPEPRRMRHSARLPPKT